MPPYVEKKIRFFEFIGEKRRGETDFEKASCTQREHGQKFERRGERG